MTERPRLDKLAPAELDSDQRALYAQITGGPRSSGPQAFALVDEAGGLEGPFNAMLLNPPLGAALQELGSAIRYRGQLSDRAREIAILTVAEHWGSEFETYAHERVATRIGLDLAVLAALREGATDRLGGLLDDEGELLVGRTVHALVRGDLDDEQYAAATAGLGQGTVFELVTLVGYYATLALALRVFRVAVPDLAERTEPAEPP